MTTPAAAATAARKFRPTPISLGGPAEAVLISRYNFDNGAAGDGVNGVDGTVEGTWTSTAADSLVAGLSGASFYKTGGPAHVLLPASNALHDLPSVSVSFYFQPAGSSAKHVLFTASDQVPGNDPGDFSIERLPNGRLRAWHVGSDGGLRFFEGTLGIAATNLVEGTAYRITMTLGPTGARLYLDDMLVATIIENTNGWNNAQSKYLGIWSDGADTPAQGVFDRLRIWSGELTLSGVIALEDAQSITLPGVDPPVSFSCAEGENPVDLGNATNRETTTSLSSGGDACYDATGIISRIRWLGAQGCSGPNRHDTTNQFLFRWTANHNGGRIFGASWYGNLTPHEDYDPADDPGNFSLYPCSDQGGMYIRAPSLIGFSIIGSRAHGAWDPFRMARGGSEVQTDTVIEGNWVTCIRDDVCENDSYIDEAIFRDNLIGDVIGTGPTNSGCFRFYSLAGAESDHTAKTVYIDSNLVWASQMRASSRARAIASYAVGDFFKFKTAFCPRVELTDNIFMADARCFGANSGDPLANIRTNNVLQVSTNNVLIWRDLGNNGTYTSLWGAPPTGFTVLEGSEGEDEWDLQVNNWKTAHPDVRRFNITGIQRPFGAQSHDGVATFNLVDVG